MSVRHAAGTRPAALPHTSSCLPSRARIPGGAQSAFLPASLSASRLLAAAAFALVLTGCQKAEAPPPAPQENTVTVLPIATQRLAVEESLAGRTVAHMIAEMRPQVGGIIQKRLFTEGQEVKEGQVLYQLDAASYEAAYDNAKATLAQAQAAVLSAKPKAQRYRDLLAIDAVSKQDVDDAEATLRQNRAAVVAAQASLQSAKINLDYTRIKAPISGRIGTSTYTPGALVTASQDTALTTIQQLDPIYVDVTQTSAQLLQLRKAIDSGALQAVNGRVKVKIFLEDGSVYNHEGTLEFVGTSISTSTGNITLRAVVPNPDGLLLPGAYVRAMLPLAIDEHAILIPQTALTRNTRGEAVVKLVGDDNKVEERVIGVADTDGDQWIVTGGLKAGEKLIVEGGSRVSGGQTVKIESTQPAHQGTVKVKTGVKGDAAAAPSPATPETGATGSQDAAPRGDGTAAATADDAGRDGNRTSTEDDSKPAGSSGPASAETGAAAASSK